MARFSSFFLFLALAITATSIPSPVFAQPLPQSVPTNAAGIADPAEYQAYVEALNTDNPFKIDGFLKQYPQSNGLENVLEHGIAPYLRYPDYAAGYWASGEDEVLEFARRLREIAPDDVRALAVITILNAKRISVGRRDLIPEMCEDSRSGLKQFPGWYAPNGLTRSEWKRLRDDVAYTFDVAAGECAFLNKDFVAARIPFRMALRLFPTQLETVYLLALSDLQEPIDPQGFAYCDKTVQLLRLRGENSRRSADSVARYCHAVYERRHRTAASPSTQQASSEQFPRDPFALEGNSVARPQ